MANISTCNDGRCQFCKRGSLDNDINFWSNCSNKHFSIDFDASCKNTCCIYLITCKCCGLKYVGKSKMSVRTRFNGHRGNLQHGSEAFVMTDHFMGDKGHGINNMMVKPIEMVPNSKQLNKRENFWIAELNTVYPYGLNMDASYGGIKNAYTYVTRFEAGKAIYTLFNSVKSTRNKRGRRRSRINNEESVFNCAMWINDFVNHTQHDTNMIHTLRTEIFKLKRDELKMLFLDNARKIMSGNFFTHSKHPYFHYVIRDLCLFKLQKLHVKPSRAYLVIAHTNKMIDDVNMSRLIGNKYVESLFPANNVFYSKPGISYSYNKSIRSNIVNYRQTIEDPNHQEFECHCDNYPEKFIDAHHKHIYTGDMNIVKNNELRNILSKGFGFHDQQPPNKCAAYTSILSGIDSYINKTSEKLSLSVLAFQAWKCEILKRVRYSLDNNKIYKFNNVLSKPRVKQELSKLKQHFVLVPVDKAGKNISIICKKYYLEVMSNEIENSETFKEVSDNKLQFINRLKTRFPGKLTSDKLPYLYATSKMHKNPTSFRFITAGRDTAFSDMSIIVSKCLKLLMNTARTSLSYRIKGIDDCIFVIDNREKVINFINTCNQVTGNSKNISTWDFSTLYTKIPHRKLKEKMSTFVKKVFHCVQHSSRAANFISCSHKSRTAYYSKIKSSTNISFSCNEVIELINLIIDNCYIVFHGKIYQQTIGIPMGTNCAPFFANIFLHVYEYEYLTSLIEMGDIETAKKLAKTFRYQDDCVAINDDGVFRNHYLRIYPCEMLLKGTNISKATCTFLDLKISIFRGKFRHKSYDKRKEFNFEIANYPHLGGNIPYSASYGVYVSQLVRLCDINLEASSFTADVKEMTTKFAKQGFDKYTLKSTFFKFRDRYLFKWSKFGIDMSDIAKSIFTS